MDMLGTLMSMYSLCMISAAPPQGFNGYQYYNIPRVNVDIGPSGENASIVNFNVKASTRYMFCDYGIADVFVESQIAAQTNTYCVKGDLDNYTNEISTYSVSVNSSSFRVILPVPFYDFNVYKHVIYKPGTRTVNSSPVTNMVSVVLVQDGCDKTLTVPVWDSDGDVVTCYLPSFGPGCLGCNSLTMITMDRASCAIRFGQEYDSSVDLWNLYTVEVRIEDFAGTNLSTPLSDISIHFSVIVYSSNTSCDDIPRFIRPTPDDGAKVTVRDNEKINITISVASTNELYNIEWTVDKEVTASNMRSSMTEDGVISWRSFEWTTLPEDRQAYIMCISATEKVTGKDADVRCVYFIRFAQQANLFPYGVDSEDEILEKTDDSCSGAITVDGGVPMFGQLHHDIYVCANGIVSFDQPFTNPTPARDLSSLGDVSVLAPYCSDIDLLTSGTVFYRSSNLLESQPDGINNILEPIKSNITKFDNVADYNPTFLLIVTWYKAKPFRSTQTNEEATFQMILITDGELTYAMYLYGQMSWHSVISLPDIWIGYSVRGTYQETNVNSFTRLALNIDENVETLDVKGVLLFKLTVPNLVTRNHKVRCLRWFNKFSNQLLNIHAFSSILPACPCDIDSLFLHPWFDLPRPSTVDVSIVCSEIWPVARYRPHGKSCCYNTTTGLWTDEVPHAGSYHEYHPSTFPRQHNVNDRDAMISCCLRSNLCQLFYNLRPIGTCERTQRFQLGTTWGDPHFKTLDNKTFTSNGLGEFVFLKLDNFTLQARTERAEKADGNLSDATIFTAFAAEDNINASVQVELKPDRGEPCCFGNSDMRCCKEGIVIGRVVVGRENCTLKPRDGINLYGNKVDLTLQFYKELEDDGRFHFIANEGNLIITSESPNITTIFFPANDISLNISIGASMLTLNSVIPNKFKNKTSGLSGNYDGYADNDFQTPDGEIKDSTMTERGIHAYGMTWAVTQDTSVFIYPHGKTHTDYHFPDYQPRFLDEVPDERQTEAKEQCGSEENIECIFDFVFTGSIEIALNTKTVKINSEEVNGELRKRTPYLEGCGTVNISVGDTVICPLKVDDDEGLTFHLSDNNVGAYFNETSNTIVYVPISDDPVDIRMTVVNMDQKTSPEIRVSIVLCTGCNDHGTCLLNVTREDVRNTESFKYAKCECLPEYQGMDCENDFDGCASKPCSQGRVCTDLPADEHRQQAKSFVCGPCPIGFQEDGHKCIDINECDLVIDTCQHVCTNTEGSFACSCNLGYRIDQNNAGQCDDINECDESISSCDQTCVNTDGSFNCTCYEGYHLQNGKCVRFQDLCENATETNCSATDGCTLDEGGSARCFCHRGYELVNNGTECQDIDECLQNVCPQTCKNSIGGFSCSCYSGFLFNDINGCEACEFPYWGINCENTCQCSSRGAVSCSSVRGCVCTSGWRGISCGEDIDECLDSPGICGDVRKVCTNTNGSYICPCVDGFRLHTDGSCQDVDECSDPVLHDCAQVCSNTEGGYSCECVEGFTKLGTTQCQDIDECAAGQSGCEQSCENFPGFYNCYCYFGFVLNNDRRTCSEISNPCETYSNLTCAHLCFVENNQAECRCNLGYTLNEDGETCTDVNECTQSDINLCSNGASCVNTDGSYQCVCPIGFKLQNDRRTCQICDKFHYGLNCQEECACVHGMCNNIRGCLCNSGWSGSKCDVDINECLTSQVACSLQNSICTNTPGSFSCDCASGFQLTDGSCQDINECADVRAHHCSQVCVNTFGSYRCSCETGFVTRQGSCEDINECSGINGCEQDCGNTVGSYRCTCRPGFKLDLTDRQSCLVADPCGEMMTNVCDDQNADCYMDGKEEKCLCRKGFEEIESNCVDVKECSQDPSPCEQTCIELEGGYSCDCADGFQLDTDMSTCIACAQGSYGYMCEQDCSCNMGNTEICHPVNGQCTCMNGWIGDICDVDVNECSNASSCHHSAHCINTDGSFQCRCQTGFIPTSNGVCQACDAWRYGDDCMEDCECVISNSASCGNVDGECQCLQGWQSPTCVEDIDECGFGSCLDVANSYCSNTPGNYTCQCLNGFVNVNGSCEDIDECADTGLCLQVCHNSPGTYSCLCYDGFYGDGYHCKECKTTMYGFNCSEECQCSINATTTNDDGRHCDAANGTCFCSDLWTGLSCDEDINECADNQICVDIVHAGCHNIDGGYSCDCYRGYAKDDGGICVKGEPDSRVNQTALDGKTVLHLTVNVNAILPDGVDFNVSTTFSEYAYDLETMLLQFYKERLGLSVTMVAFVTTLTIRGSLYRSDSTQSVMAGQYTLGYVDTTGDTNSQIFSSVLSLSGGLILTFRDQNVTVQDVTMDNACSLHATIVGGCGDNQNCIVEEGHPVCREKQKDNFLVVVIVLSSSGSFLLILIIIGLCARLLRGQNHKEEETGNTATDFVPDPLGMKKKGMTWRRRFWKERTPSRGPFRIPRVTIDAGSHNADSFADM